MPEVWRHDLAKVDLSGIADLSMIDMAGVKLCHAFIYYSSDLRNTDLRLSPIPTDVDLTMADLRGVDLRETGRRATRCCATCMDERLR